MANWKCKFCTNNNNVIISTTDKIIKGSVILTQDSKSKLNGCFVLVSTTQKSPNNNYSVYSYQNLNCEECLSQLYKGHTEKKYNEFQVIYPDIFNN